MLGERRNEVIPGQIRAIYQLVNGNSPLRSTAIAEAKQQWGTVNRRRNIYLSIEQFIVEIEWTVARLHQ
jgi:hypothetical protein